MDSYRASYLAATSGVQSLAMVCGSMSTTRGFRPRAASAAAASRPMYPPPITTGAFAVAMASESASASALSRT